MAFQYLLLLLLALTFISFANPTKVADMDVAIRDYIFRSPHNNNTNLRTGQLHNIHLTPNLWGINVDLIRLRCGSLQRYGARIKEFDLPSGVKVYPCITRVFVVRQSCGLDCSCSSLYYNTYDLSGYQLISPVLGLNAYQIHNSGNSNTTPTQVSIVSGKRRPITVDFTSLVNNNTSSPAALCASFDGEGRVSVYNQEQPNVCVAKGGQLGLVVVFRGKLVSKVKIVVVSSIGAALGAFLLSLLMVAMLAKKKMKKNKKDDMERRAYEEEAFQVSMVGHVHVHHHQYPTPSS
ncbi:hypothetical protein ACS0TY_013105 [Phlomoides rotata]